MNTREDMRPQFCASQQVAVTFTLIDHPNRDIDPCPVEWTRQRIRDVAMKRNFLHVAIEKNDDPALAESVKAKRPAA